MLLIKHPNAKNIIGEIMARLELIEVRGESVEQLFFVRRGLKELLETATDRDMETPNKERGGES